MANVPKHEGITGASLSGSSGAVNRTYVLTNSDAILAQAQFIIAGAILQANIDFTLNTTTDTVTFINNVWDDQNISLDYFVDDSTSTVLYDADSVTIVGSDLTGTTGTANRTFIFVSNKNIVSEMMQVTIDNAILTIGDDFTFNETTKTVTFLNVVVDGSNISIDYLFAKQSYYATTLQVIRYSGVGIAVQLENLGTGDSSERSYDTEFGNIVDASVTLQYGASGSNQLSILVEGTDYQIALDDGAIYLTASGLTALSTNVLYISYTYSPKQSDTVLVSYMAAAQAEADKLTNNYWGVNTTATEYFDGYTSGYPTTDRPFGFDIQNIPEFDLKFKGIQSITSVEYLDGTGAVSGTPDTDYIQFDDNGRLILGATTVPNGKRNVKVVYVHGYSSVPDLIQELTALIGGMMALVNISGGSYKDISTYSLGRKSFSIGQVYVNIESSIRQMNARIESITESMGWRFAVA